MNRLQDNRIGTHSSRLGLENLNAELNDELVFNKLSHIKDKMFFLFISLKTNS